MVGESLLGDDTFQDASVAIHSIRVGRLFAGHQGGAQAVGGGDHRHTTSAGNRVRAERHAGATRVDHPLDQDRGWAAGRRQAVGAAVRLEAFAEGGTPYCRHRLGHLRGRDEEKALELPGERVVGAVLFDGRRAHGHRLAVWAEPGQRLEDFAERLGPRRHPS